MASIRDHSFYLDSPGQSISWKEQVFLMFCILSVYETLNINQKTIDICSVKRDNIRIDLQTVSKIHRIEEASQAIFFPFENLLMTQKIHDETRQTSRLCRTTVCVCQIKSNFICHIHMVSRC